MHLLQIGLAVVGKVFLVDNDIDDLGHEVATRIALIDFLHHAALHGHGEVGKHWRIDHAGPLHCPPCLGHLIFFFLAAHDAHIVGSSSSLGSGKGHRELRTSCKIGSSLMTAKRNHDFVVVPCACPCGIHGIGSSIGIIGAYHYYCLWHEPRLWTEILHELIFFFDYKCKYNEKQRRCQFPRNRDNIY